MFACLYIPDFPVEAIVRVEPELREQAVAVVEGKPPLLKVLALNERARQFGIEAGMTQLQAQGYAPSLALRKRAPLQEQAAHAALMDCACAISPRVYGEAPDTVLLDLHGLERLFGPPAKIARELARRVGELGMEANVGVAANVETAIHAARGFTGTTVISRGREAERLASLSVEVLFDPRDERAPEMLETLERWGVRTFRALALLPEIALSQRLGEAGVHLRKLARGEGSRPLVPSEPPLEFEEVVELEDAIDLLEPLAFVLNRMLEQLCTRLATRSLAAQELRLKMELDPQEDVYLDSADTLPPRSHGNTEKIGSSNHRFIGSSGEHSAINIHHLAQRHAPYSIPHTENKSEIRIQKSEIDKSRNDITSECSKAFELTLKFPVPMLDVKVFVKLLQLELRARPPQAPVMKIWLRAEPARPRSTQGGLFLPEAPEPERLEVTLARIAGVVGEQKNSPQRHRDTEKIGSSDHRVIGSSDGNSAASVQHAEQKSHVGMNAEPVNTNQGRSSDHPPIRSSDELRVGSAEVLDTHKPDAFRVKRFAASSPQPANNRRRNKSEIRNSKSEIPGCLALRRFRPLVPAVVRVENGRPVWLAMRESARAADRVGEYRIVWASGPWRASGEWWSEQQWSRDVWDVAVTGETVTVYRIYYEREEWWVEGSYD